MSSWVVATEAHSTYNVGALMFYKIAMCFLSWSLYLSWWCPIVYWLFLAATPHRCFQENVNGNSKISSQSYNFSLHIVQAWSLDYFSIESALKIVWHLFACSPNSLSCFWYSLLLTLHFITEKKSWIIHCIHPTPYHSGRCWIKLVKPLNTSNWPHL